MATALRDLYGLIGDPVSHSLSPDIQAAAFALLSKSSAYLPFHVEPAKLEAAVAGARALGLRGFNVTIPHKERVAELVDALEGDASQIRAVNVVVNHGGRLVGHNTDTLAIAGALERVSVPVKGSRVLVLGAGGSARAAAFALGRAGAAEVIVANRTFRRARDLALQLATLGYDTLAAPLTPASLRELVPLCNVVVNATSVGLNRPDESPLPDNVQFEPTAVAIDLVYRPLKTRFLQQARAQELQTVDGVDILVHQAIGALSIWLKRPIDPIRLAPLMRTAALEALL